MSDGYSLCNDFDSPAIDFRTSLRLSEEIESLTSGQEIQAKALDSYPEFEPNVEVE